MENIKKIIRKVIKDFNYKIKVSLFKYFKDINILLFKNLGVISISIKSIKKSLFKNLGIIEISLRIIKISLFKTFGNIKNLSNYKSKSEISTFNKCLIGSIVLLFFYLFYLTIPGLYGDAWVQNKIENKLLKEFKINFSLSSEISYQILPSPNFTIKNVKIFDDSDETSKTFGGIKTFKVFISQKNLFNKEKIKINKILITEANFLIDKNNFDFFKKFTNKIFSQKKIRIKKSNLFFKDEAGETLLINKIKHLVLYFDKENLLNTIKLNGEVLNIPYNLNFTKNLMSKKNTTLVKSKKLKINYKNVSTEINKHDEGINIISFLNSKLKTEYKLEKKILTFKSKDSKLPNNKINYEGKIDIDPFDFNINIDLEKINLNKILNNNSIFFSFIKSGLLFNNNISANIFLNSKQVLDNKIFKKLKINFIIQDGSIYFDSSQFLIDKIGSLVLVNGKLVIKKNNIIFFGDFNLKLNDSNKFFSAIQTRKNNRRLIKNIYFNIEFDLLKDQLYLNNFKIDDLVTSDETHNVLDDFNRNNGQINNLIIFNNLMNKILNSYSG